MLEEQFRQIQKEKRTDEQEWEEFTKLWNREKNFYVNRIEHLEKLLHHSYNGKGLKLKNKLDFFENRTTRDLTPK